LSGQHRQHQIAVARGNRVDQLGDLQPRGNAQDRGHVPVLQAAGDLERLGQIHPRGQALQYLRQCLNLGLGPAGQIGQGAGFHLAGLAVAFPQQDRRR